MLFQPKNSSLDEGQLIKIEHKSLHQVREVKFLGLTIDHKLTWESHIDNFASKLCSICFVIRQLKPTVTLDVLKLTYHGLVHSVLSYGLIFWRNSAHMNKVLLLQKRIIRSLSFGTLSATFYQVITINSFMLVYLSIGVTY